MRSATTMLVALVIDAGLGWPPALHARIGHPVTWIGAMISALDRRLNRDGAPDASRRAAGVLTALAVIGASAGVGWIAMAIAVALLPDGWAGVLLSGVLAWPLIAARAMHDHVAAVARPLLAGDIETARRAIAMIVGRDTSVLDAAGVSRAATESLAENTSDGIVAPIFWGVLLGLPGIAAYKAINTLDSMIGHRTPRHEAFGWASARIDDLANLIPARLTGFLLAVVSTRPRAALATMLRGARFHRSPNAGWPEAAIAGALNIRLSGPRVYAGRVAEEPWLNEAAPDPRPDDLKLALALYRRAMLVLAGSLVVLAVI
jgi:adenosylcobinamide-phosphate synthase